MSRFLFASFLLSFVDFFLSPCIWAAERNKAHDAPLTVRVRLYDYASLSEETLTEAKKAVTLIFRQAGVETVWLSCPTAPTTEVVASSCGLPQGLADLVVRVLPRDMVEKVEVFRGYYGFAWPAAEGRFATMASVFHHEVVALARDEGYSEASLLGYLIAHEMGHLLLGLGSHSLNGLMRHPWRRQELDQAARGILRFNARQCRRIREDVRARSRKSR